ncbi:hypothetical protein [Euzebya tangerina]|uniref:hypothetical protein n=1 Tax=Euzebya tangerina TaxID=591198 RepID=UPI000E30D355|nr:hypothetical protein [Euzebya tangerina]
MRRLRPDDGQTTIEWLGIAAVIVALLTALVLISPGIGDGLADDFRCLVSRITGGDSCGRPDVADGGPTQPCVVASNSDRFDLGVTVVVVDVDGSYGFITEELSDGTVRVTEVVRGQGGVSTGVGGGVTVNAGDQQVGGAAEAGAGAGVFIELGNSVIVADQDAADGYIEDRLVSNAIHSNPITGLPIVSDLAEGGLGLIGIGGNDVDTEQDGVSVEVGVTGTAVAEAVGGVASAELSAGLEAAAGHTLKPDGSIESTFIIDAELAGSIGIPALADVDLGSGGTHELTVTFAPDGTIDTVALTVTSTVTQDSSLISDDPGEALEQLADSVVNPQDATEQVVMTFELDVDSPELEQATVDFIVSLAPGGEPLDENAAALGTAIVENSTVTRQVYELNDGVYGIDASGDFIVGGRLSANLIRENARLVEAAYYDPSTGQFEPWINCFG